MSIDVEGQLSGREYDLKFLLKHAIDRKSSDFILISAMALNHFNKSAASEKKK